jgi:cytochrome c-type biogenesis protein
MFVDSVSFPAALLAGLLSFFSPCVLPLIPAYFTFISGLSFEDLTAGQSSVVKKKVILATIFFILGFSLVFILLGASASLLGNLFMNYREYIRVIGGAIIVVLGIHLTGLFRIRWLDIERRIHLSNRPLHFLGTFVIGMAFGAGWTPCVGPLLGAILIMAGSQETVWKGVVLLGIYSMGLAIPFLALSAFIHFMLHLLKKMRNAMRYLNPAAGVLLVIVGLVLVTDNLNFLVRLY